MRTIIKKVALLLIPFLLAGDSLEAAVVSTVHSFGPESFDPSTSFYTNSDGYYPEAVLLFSSNMLYGTAYEGCTNGYGTIYRVNADGTGFTNLHNFDYLDGENPRSSLVLCSNTLYGTTSGGDIDLGSIFAIQTDGSGFTNILYFGGYPYFDFYPQAGVVLSSNMLFGTVMEGGTYGLGAVFRVNTDGSSLTNLHNFFTGNNNQNGTSTNSDGENPYADLFLSTNVLYGTTEGGGTNGTGTVFRVNTDGTDFTNLHNFALPTSSVPGKYINSDGAHPMSGVILFSNALYGATYDGGVNGTGVVYKLNPDGTGFTNLFVFNAYNPLYYTNYGGGNSAATLTASSGKLYGTTEFGGAYGGGTFFSVDANGNFTNLFDFVVNSTFPGGPSSGVVASGNTFYGPSYGGGTNETGTVYALAFGQATIPLSIQIASGSLVISWSDAAFMLQTAPDLAGPYEIVTNGVSPYTVSPTNQQQYFRLESD